MLAMALGGFVKCPLHLPFASGLRRAAQHLLLPALHGGCHLPQMHFLIAFGTWVCVQEVWPLEQLEFRASPGHSDSLTYFWAKKPS